MRMLAIPVPISMKLIYVLIHRVRAYGPGIEPTGPVVGAPANFTVETFSAGKGNVDVVVEDPKGAKIPVMITFNRIVKLM